MPNIRLNEIKSCFFLKASSRGTTEPRDATQTVWLRVPSHRAGGGPAPGGTCVCRHRRVAIAAIRSRTVPLPRATRLTSPVTAEEGPAAPGGTCVFSAIAAECHWRAAIALARHDRSGARAVSRARCNRD